MLDGIEDFVIIDDFPYEFEKIFPVHFVQTKSGKGLTYKECEFCIINSITSYLLLGFRGF